MQEAPGYLPSIAKQGSKHPPKGQTDQLRRRSFNPGGDLNVPRPLEAKAGVSDLGIWEEISVLLCPRSMVGHFFSSLRRFIIFGMVFIIK